MRYKYLWVKKEKGSNKYEKNEQNNRELWDKENNLKGLYDSIAEKELNLHMAHLSSILHHI